MKSCVLVAIAGVNAVVAASGNVTAHCENSEKCQSLIQVPGLQDKVYTPEMNSYAQRLETYFSKSAALEPWCMVLPETSEHVSLIVTSLVARDCPFGVRGGGHGAHALSNSVEEGVTIDFGYMNTTLWDLENRLVSVQPGGHWIDVYDELTPHGVTVAGGRAGTVGVGGFLSGGGITFFAASHGMACDSVVNFEVVLADGSITEANATSNADLWKALKGGSSNLGLITRFDMKPIDYADPDEPAIWGGNLIFPPEAGPDLIDVLVDFTENVRDDENSATSVSFSYQPVMAGGTVVLASLENTVGKTKARAFDGFYEVYGMLNDTTRLDTMSGISSELSEGQPTGFRNTWFTLSFDNDPRPLKYALEKFNELNSLLEDIVPSSETGFSTVYTIQPLTESIIEKSVAIGGNAMGMDRHINDGNGILFLVILAIEGADAERSAVPLVETFAKDVEAYAGSLGLGRPWKYLNYAHSSQDPIATFGDDTIGLLRAASRKYDPKGVFQRLRVSGFKIPWDWEALG